MIIFGGPGQSRKNPKGRSPKNQDPGLIWGGLPEVRKSENHLHFSLMLTAISKPPNCEGIKQGGFGLGAGSTASQVGLVRPKADHLGGGGGEPQAGRDLGHLHGRLPRVCGRFSPTTAVLSSDAS